MGTITYTSQYGVTTVIVVWLGSWHMIGVTWAKECAIEVGGCHVDGDNSLLLFSYDVVSNRLAVVYWCQARVSLCFISMLYVVWWNSRCAAFLLWFNVSGPLCSSSNGSSLHQPGGVYAADHWFVDRLWQKMEVHGRTRQLCYSNTIIGCSMILMVKHTPESIWPRKLTSTQTSLSVCYLGEVCVAMLQICSIVV